MSDLFIILMANVQRSSEEEGVRGNGKSCPGGTSISIRKILPSGDVVVESGESRQDERRGSFWSCFQENNELTDLLKVSATADLHPN